MTSLASLDPDQSRHAIGRSLRLVPREPRRPRDRPPRRADGRAPDVAGLIAVVVRAVLEVEVGRRPLSQLDGVLAPAVSLELAHRQRRLSERARRSRVPLVGPAPGSVVRVLGQEPTGHAYEATALVRSGERTTAIAVRAERYQGAWRIVELARPEDRAAARGE